MDGKRGGIQRGTNSAVCFGVCRNSPDLPTDKLFTGQRLDGTGLYYYNARYYDPTIGRFISADTVVQSIFNPQCLNRYFYCSNNPLKYIDSDGHGFWGSLWNGAKGFLRGVNDGCKDLVTSAVQFVRSDPVVVFQNALYSVTHLGDTWNALNQGFYENTQSAYGWGKIVVDTAFLFLPVGSEKYLSSAAKLAEEAAKAKRVITVLGKLGTYEKLGDELGANYFRIADDIWDAMSTAEKWAANQKFLDEAITRGDIIILSNPVKSIEEATGYFRTELEYLEKNGYRLSEDGTQMIKD
jgi:RHS repeat-associated protein